MSRGLSPDCCSWIRPRWRRRGCWSWWLRRWRHSRPSARSASGCGTPVHGASCEAFRWPRSKSKRSRYTRTRGSWPKTPAGPGMWAATVPRSRQIWPPGSRPRSRPSAGQRGPKSAVRRAHHQLVAWIPGAELQVWEGTRHPLHIQQPGKVAAAVLTLL